jgi:acetyl esterase/lipase
VGCLITRFMLLPLILCATLLCAVTLDDLNQPTPARELVYKHVGDRALKLHMFTPEGPAPARGRPALLWIHGGGWTGGSVESFFPLARAFVSRGAVGFSLEYRLVAAGGPTVADAVADCKSAVRYLRSHARELGLDPDRIAALGDSAGGHLAATTGLLDGFEAQGEDCSVSSRPNALVLYNPLVDFLDSNFIKVVIGGDALKPKPAPEALVPGEDAKRLGRALSPVYQIHSGQPPAIVLHGLSDTVIPPDHARRLATAMKDAGNRCDLELWPDTPHAFVISNYKSSEPVVLSALRSADTFLSSLGFLEGAFDLRLSAHAAALDACNVAWTAPGSGSVDSMPLGNGDLALNVWTEKNGDLLFTLAKSDAWSEQDKSPLGLLKLGRIRVSMTPSPFAGGPEFRQALRLREGEITVQGGKGASAATLRLWVDANRPVVRVDCSAAAPVAVQARYEGWRRQPDGKISADVVLPNANGRLAWYHRDEKPDEPRLLGHTFGGLLSGDGFVSEGADLIRSAAPATRHTLSVHALTSATPTADDWMKELRQLAAANDSTRRDLALIEHRRWWDKFWERSWITVTGDADAATVTRGYALQRFITACAGRGAYPIKFNGSLFTVENPALNTGRDKATGKDLIKAVPADYRAWGGQYWFQNTRPIYWPLLATGDTDLIQPFFSMYSTVAQNNAGKVRAYYNHDGSYLAETAPFHGGIPKLTPEANGGYTAHYYTPILELSAMMLDYHAYTGDDAFFRKTLLPLAKAGLTFYDKHFPRDARGRLLLDPANSIEMYWKVRNSLPDIAGLRYVLDRLLALPEPLVGGDLRREWTRLRAELPELPVGERDGRRVLLPYEEGQEHKPHNSENPELYAVYPFRLYGVGKPDLEVALGAFERRLHKAYHCWGQDPVQGALLGLTGEARKGVVRNFSNKDPRLAFPAFWAKGHDYEPDQCNGGNAMLALQRMLLQCEDRRILLLPAWPAGWEADFKLHAPYSTTLSGSVRGGKLVDLRVNPESRRADVELPLATDLGGK